jgi:hypothetical protein
VSATPGEHPSLRLRLHVFRSRARLDREIAGGAVVLDSAARQLREAQLTTREERRGIAAVLRVVLDSAQERSTRGLPSRHRDIQAVLDNRDGLLELIELLRAATPMSAQAVALAQALACERGSPLLSPDSERTIEQSLAQIAATMPRR